jgi:hypothetical protein
VGVQALSVIPWAILKSIEKALKKKERKKIRKRTILSNRTPSIYTQIMKCFGHKRLCSDYDGVCPKRELLQETQGLLIWFHILKDQKYSILGQYLTPVCNVK